ncbi:tyrosine 3-monooxygenase-like [Acanthaster planci]|uniref:Tyrosine 3-monooxygenase-like n=1 Tax=Acanthaster planci TaxID=133434 RepID=A0A8B7Z0X4_ACAPL|nr:tyrosine 3-monooxygenase-like [Acanthaster planci]
MMPSMANELPTKSNGEREAPSPPTYADMINKANMGAKTPMNGINQGRLSISFTSRKGDEFASLIRAANAFEAAKVKLSHMESRTVGGEKGGQEFLVQCDLSNGACPKNLIASLQNCVDSVVLHEEDGSEKEEIWFPRHISDLDLCKHLIPGFTPDVDLDHPGHLDEEYCARRMEIAQIAFKYKYGQPIPRVNYSDEDTKTWGDVYRKVTKLFPTHASKECIAGLKTLEDIGLYSPDFVPQLEDVSNFLKEKSGFQLRPVAGLLTARDFLASLAFRTFQTTQYIRHHSSPAHTPEPDCCHELLGHVPMLASPEFAQFSQELGMASLGASDEDIVKLARLYWYTVEVGLCKEEGQVRVYGAAVLSSPGETMFALSDKPERVPFEALRVSMTSFDEKNYQPVFFVTESIEDAKQKLRSYTNTMKKPFDVRYDPYTKKIITLDRVENVRDTVREMKGQLNTVSSALEKISA